LMSSFFRAILGFLDYKLPILDVSHLEHPCLKVSEQLALKMVLIGSASCTSWLISRFSSGSTSISLAFTSSGITVTNPLRDEVVGTCRESVNKQRELKGSLRKPGGLPLQQKMLLESGQLNFQPMMNQGLQWSAAMLGRRDSAGNHPKAHLGSQLALQPHPE
jgi:hypothetical protein